MTRKERALVKETRALIKEVEAGDTDHAAWIAIQDRVRELKEDRTQTEVAELLGKDARSWVADVLAWRRDRDTTPFATSARGRESAAKRHEAGAKKVLADPKQRAKVLSSLDNDEIEEIIEDANDTVLDRVRAKRAERQTEPSAGQLMGGDKFDPAEHWVDNIVIRIHNNVGELHGLTQREGWRFGTMSPEEALGYLEESERLLAELRAATQEMVRDQKVVA